MRTNNKARDSSLAMISHVDERLIGVGYIVTTTGSIEVSLINYSLYLECAFDVLSETVLVARDATRRSLVSSV